MLKSVEIRLEDFKRLVNLMENPDDSIADVIQRLLDADDDAFVPAIQSSSKLPDLLDETAGFFIRGITIPNGTQLAARYKGKTYKHDIAKGRWIDSEGRQFDSPSSAASHITKNNVNGWRFWLALRPGDSQWRRLDQLLNQ